MSRLSAEINILIELIKKNKTKNRDHFFSIPKVTNQKCHFSNYNDIKMYSKTLRTIMEYVTNTFDNNWNRMKTYSDNKLQTDELNMAMVIIRTRLGLYDVGDKLKCIVSRMFKQRKVIRVTDFGDLDFKERPQILE